MFFFDQYIMIIIVNVLFSASKALGYILLCVMPYILHDLSKSDQIIYSHLLSNLTLSLLVTRFHNSIPSILLLKLQFGNVSD